VARCARSKTRFGNFVTKREHDRTPGHVMKLLRYSEDNRPPYRGTWSRVSSKVGARRPFARDEEHLDYDYDSDADWVADDQEAGENLSDADDAESDDGMEEDDEQGDFVVDDGYLSADEGLDDDGVRLADDDAAAAGARQKPRAPREHASRITLVVVGPAVAPLTSELQWRQLQRYRIVPHKPTPIRPLVVDAVEAAVDPLEALPPSPSTANGVADASNTASTADGAAASSRRSTVPENLLPELLKLMNGWLLSKDAIVDQVRQTHPTLTRVSLERALGEYCVKDKRNGVRGYFVKSEFCAQHGIEEIIDTAPKTSTSAPKPKKRTPAESNIANGAETTTPKKIKKRLVLEPKTTLTTMLSPESTHNSNVGGNGGNAECAETAPTATSVATSSTGKVALINDDDF
jgi:hypothetical protein